MRMHPSVVLAFAALLSMGTAHAQQRTKVATLSGTVGLVRPASPKALVDMSFGERMLDALANREKPLELTSELLDGDGLRSEEAGSAVMLECASGATQALTGPFDVILRIRADGKGCKIEVRDGQATATTASDPDAMPDGRPEQQYGDVTLGASSTMFGMAVSRGNLECFVIDGAITATRANVPVWALSAGQQLAVKSQAVTAISETRLSVVASTYARLDVTSLPQEQRAAKQMQLQARYVEAFRQPEDANARAQLVQAYTALGAAPSAARVYQARKKDKLQQMQIKDTAVTQPGNFIDKAVVAPH